MTDSGEDEQGGRRQPLKTNAANWSNVKTSWAAVGVLATIGLAAVGAYTNVTSRIARVESQLEYLSPESVESLKVQMADEIKQAQQSLSGLVTSTESKLDKAVARLGKPPALQWCDARSRRQSGEWYNSGEYGLELSVSTSPRLVDPDGIYTCEVVLKLRNPNIYDLITTVAGELRTHAGNAFQCRAGPVTIPVNTDFQVIWDGERVLGWVELRRQCPEVEARIAAFQAGLRSLSDADRQSMERRGDELSEDVAR